jgi:hypothetical protein
VNGRNDLERFRGQQRPKTINEGKLKMKKLHIQYRTTIPAFLMALALTCFSSLTAHAAGKGGAGGGGTQGSSIVGLWHVELFFDSDHTQPPFAQTYKQWHSDGLEFESANGFVGQLCIGTWKQMASNMVSLYHVGWTPGGAPPFFPTAVRFVLNETDTVSPDGNSYDGIGTQTFYDANDSPLAPVVTLYIHATRLPPQ